MQTVLQRRQLIFTAAALGTTLLLPACGGGGNDTDLEDRRNLMELSESKAELSVFVEAVGAAGLRDTLTGSGSNTVFAPTNDAFTALLAELGTTKDALFADKATLTAVLKYHFLGKIMARESFPLGKAIEPMQPGFFKIEETGNNAFTITDGRNRLCNIVSTDSLALNGVLHTIGRVLLPADKDIVQTASGMPALGTFVDAVAAAGLTDTLKAAGPLTVFAPSNDAFAALLTELGVTQAALLADQAQLRKILTYHVLASRTLKREIPTNEAITTTEGETIRVNSSYQITDARGRLSGISTADVFNTNGVIHVIDKVLLPA